jgi:prepilin-type N-terminal cleavage/methylation domain-containing protein
MKKGFTLIELLAVMVIIALVVAIAVPIILNTITNAKKGAMDSEAKLIIDSINKKLAIDDTFTYTDITEENIEAKLGIKAANYANLVITEVNGKPRIYVEGQGKYDGYTAYGNYNEIIVVNSDDYDVTPPVITLIGDSYLELEQGEPYTELGATANDNKDGNITDDILTIGIVDTNTEGTYTITYTVEDEIGNDAAVTRTVSILAPYNAAKGVNRPKLAIGMIPIKWNGSSWIETTATDDEWYNYTIADKKWANAKTADGSMWVWVPRYGYQISTNYHMQTAGNVNVKFLKNRTLTASDNSTVVTIATYTGASQTNYIVHPAFDFGGVQLTGMWVSKFEASVSNTSANCYTTPNTTNCNITTLTPKFVPNVSSWRYITIGNAFTVLRNMENTGNSYSINGDAVDTHLIKNVEWGATAYLSKSTFGINGEVWINPSNTFTTGCAGDSLSSTTTEGCLRTYETTNGVKASTTGNIYGVYDMSGSAFEYVAAAVNNANVSTYGLSITNASNKYRDIYTVTSGSDIGAQNYINASGKKGDAVYETSPDQGGIYSWNTDYAYMPAATTPWFTRGGLYGNANNAGIFGFLGRSGEAFGDYGFRAVLLVNSGL